MAVGLGLAAKNAASFVKGKIWGGFGNYGKGGPVIVSGKTFSSINQFKNFVNNNWGGPKGGTPEVSVTSGGSFKIQIPATLGTADFLDGINKDSPFSVTRELDGKKAYLVIKASEEATPSNDTDVVSFKHGVLYPNAPMAKEFTFKMHNGVMCY